MRQNQRIPTINAYYCACVAYCLLLPLSSTVAAQETASIKSVRIGIQGHFRLGCWTQAKISITSPKAFDQVRLEVLLPDGEGMRTVNITEGISVPVGDSTLVTRLKFGRSDSDLTVRLLANDGRLIATKYFDAADLPDAVTASQFLVVSLGQELGVGETLSLRKEQSDERTAHIPVADAMALPDEWLGYGGVNLVVMPTSAESIAASMSTQQKDALAEWVRMGGRIIISAGAESEPLLTSDSTLAKMLPGTFDRVRMQRETSNFEGYAGTTRVSLSNYQRDGDASFRLPMAALRDVRGRVELFEGLGAERTPAIVRGSYGFGHVIFLAIDLDLAPVAKWKDGRRRILKRLIALSLGEEKREETSGQYSQLTQIGFGDLTGQLRSALDQFSQIRLVPFSVIACLIGAYIVLIGPVDYLMLRRWNKRFGLTWFTFPIVVLAASALAFWLTQLWKGQALTVNQVSVIDVDSQSGALRGTVWAHVFSPSNQKYNCKAVVSDLAFPRYKPDGCLTSWQGLVGSSFGGMNTRQVQDLSMSYDIVHDSSSGISSEVRSLPINIYGSRSLHGMSWGTVDLNDVGAIQYDVDEQLSGTVKNPLPVGLKNCQLFFGRKVYPLPSLAPGGSKEVGVSSNPKAIEVILTKKTVDKDFKDVSQPWDRKSFDVNRIMQMMMFYKAAGGKKYTSLLHRYQRDIDFSDHLTQERAILVGKISQPGMTLIKGETAESNGETYVRILLPVTRAQARREFSSATRD